MLDAVNETSSVAGGNPDLHVRPIIATGLAVDRGGRTLLDIGEVSFQDQKLTAIVGPNGAGKTLLLKILAGVMQADRGVVTWAGEQPSRAGYKKLALVLQAPVLLRRTALANIMYALKAAGFERGEVQEHAMAALRLAGLVHLAATPARLLSGGEKQRLALARALAIDPEVLLLDEPVANLDPSSTLAIETMVSEARSRGVTIILVTHDLAQARRLADDIIFMHRGEIVEHGGSATFFDQPATELAADFLDGKIIT